MAVEQLAVRQLHPLFVAELTGIDLAAGIDAATQGEIERTMDRYAVTVLPGQNLDDERQTAFAALYGPLEVSPPVHSKHGGPAAQASDSPDPTPAERRSESQRQQR